MAEMDGIDTIRERIRKLPCQESAHHCRDGQAMKGDRKSASRPALGTTLPSRGYGQLSRFSGGSKLILSSVRDREKMPHTQPDQNPGGG